MFDRDEGMADGKRPFGGCRWAPRAPNVSTDAVWAV